MLLGEVNSCGLDISNEKAEMIRCPLAKALKWLDQRTGAAAERVKDVG